jgi:hypothetical protein
MDAELASKLISFVHRKIYRILSEEVGLDLPEYIEIPEEHLEREGEIYHYSSNDNDYFYSVYVNAMDDLTIGCNYISAIFGLEENSSSEQYDQAKLKEKFAYSQINKYGPQNIRKSLNDLFRGEITINEDVYVFSKVDVELDDKPYYGQGFVDLMEESKSISVSVHYNHS